MNSPEKWGLAPLQARTRIWMRMLSGSAYLTEKLPRHLVNLARLLSGRKELRSTPAALWRATNSRLCDAEELQQLRFIP